jgi:hypothetical protein
MVRVTIHGATAREEELWSFILELKNRILLLEAMS